MVLWQHAWCFGYTFITAYALPKFCFYFSGTLAHSLKEELCREIFVYRPQTFSENTKKTYQTYIDSYLRFCLTLGISSIPASTDNIALYAAFLARSLKPSSVRQYLYVIGLLHKEFSLPNPLIDNWFLNLSSKASKELRVI